MELIPSVSQEVIKFVMVAIVSILQVVIVGGAKGCQSHTKALEGGGEGDLVQFISQAANDINVVALLSKRGGGKQRLHKGSRSDTKLNGNVL